MTDDREDAGEVFWLDAPAGSDEELSVGRPGDDRWSVAAWLREGAGPGHRRRWWGAILAAAIVLGVLSAALRPSGSGTPVADRSTPSPTVSRSAPRLGPAFATPAPFDQLAAVFHATTLTNHLRENSPAGGCPTVRPGRSVITGAARVISAFVGRVVVVAQSLTIDQANGLCALELRARGPGRLTLALIIASPGPSPRRHDDHAPTLDQVEVGSTGVGADTISYARQVRHDGWTILVGVSGSDATDLHSRDLTRVVTSTALLW